MIPDVDGLHYDWTLLGKKIQAKVSRCQPKRKYWKLMHMEWLGRSNQRAVSFGAYDAIWVHCGDDQFVLLPASILRRHSVFLGQGGHGKGRMSLCLYHGCHPKQGDAPEWKKMCEKYVCSWSDDGLSAKVKQILAGC